MEKNKDNHIKQWNGDHSAEHHRDKELLLQEGKENKIKNKNRHSLTSVTEERETSLK